MRFLPFVLLVACGSVESSSAVDSAQTMVDGTPRVEGEADTTDVAVVMDRPYAVTKPSRYQPGVATPLVILLHGYSGSGRIIDDYFKMSAVAEQKTFLLAVPDGTKDSANKQFWNANDACCNFDRKNVDDVAYLRSVIADMKARFTVDPKRVFIVGHSNGGFMAYRLACEMSSDIAAIVSLAGATMQCAPENPVAVLEVHGDDDGVVFINGGKLAAATVRYPAAKDTVAEWAANNGCDATLSPTGQTRDLDGTLAGAETLVARHACTQGAAEFWTIKRGLHVPHLLPSAAERFYEFLEAHPKN